MKKNFARSRVLLTTAFILSFLLHHVAGAAGLNDKQRTRMLEAGRKLVAKKEPERAIREDFDPVIDDFEQRYNNPSQHVYSSHGMVETIMYSALATGTKKDGEKPAVGTHIAIDPNSVAATTEEGGKVTSLVVDGVWVDALILKAYAQVELNDQDQAEAVLNRAVALAPMYSAPHLELGYIQQRRRRWDQSMEELKSAEELAAFDTDEKVKNDHITRAWRGQAFVLTETGHLDESEALYQKCLKLNRNDKIAKNELTYIAGLRKKQTQPQ